MSECIDAEAREMASKAQRFAGEIGAALWGDHVLRDNGVRSQVRRHEDRLDAAEADQRELRGDLRHYLDSERAATCIGKFALEEYIDTKTRETDELRKARMTLYTAVLVASISAIASIFVAVSSQKTQLQIAQLALSVQTQGVAPQATRYPLPVAEETN